MEIENSASEKTILKTSKNTVSEQVAFDLAQYLNQFRNPAYGIRFLAKECGISAKTIKRLMQQENLATYQTLIKLYSVFLEKEDYESMLNECPEVIRTNLIKYSPKPAMAQESKANRLLEVLSREDLNVELFVLALISPLKTAEIERQFGRTGLAVLSVLEKENILVQNRDKSYGLSPSVPNLDGNVLKVLGLYVTQKYSRQRSVGGENVIAFYAEGLNAEGLKKWIEIDSKSFYEKMEIAKNPFYQGENPAYTFCTTDLLKRGE